jgi:hypothetical protein
MRTQLPISQLAAVLKAFEDKDCWPGLGKSLRHHSH